MRKKKDTSFLLNGYIAHRGLHNNSENIPENTMLAFKKAINKNLTIELDVHILKDGQIVVFHDDNLKRLTGINKELKNLTYDEIKYLKVGSSNEGIPLLKDVLSLVSGKVPLIIELKYDVKCGILEKELIKLLKNYNGKFAIKSFNPRSVYYFKKHFPEAIRGQLLGDFKTKKVFNAKRVFFKNLLFSFISKPDFISCDSKILNDKYIKCFRKKGIVLAWTIRNKKEIQILNNLCDNFICEDIL